MKTTSENHKFVVGAVINITKDKVSLADGQSLQYDYLILATGSSCKILKF